jgi:hypothetical protein
MEEIPLRGVGAGVAVDCMAVILNATVLLGKSGHLLAAIANRHNEALAIHLSQYGP